MTRHERCPKCDGEMERCLIEERHVSPRDLEVVIGCICVECGHKIAKYRGVVDAGARWEELHEARAMEH